MDPLDARALLDAMGSKPCIRCGHPASDHRMKPLPGRMVGCQWSAKENPKAECACGLLVDTALDQSNAQLMKENFWYERDSGGRTHYHKDQFTGVPPDEC